MVCADGVVVENGHSIPLVSTLSLQFTAL
jgi:hypothetical protein